jgi:polysaccharide biosynthesis protein PslH
MKALFFSHVRDPRAANGGMVYSNHVLAQLRRACERVDVLYVYGDLPKSRRARIALASLRSVFGHLPAKALYFDRSSVRKQFARYLQSEQPDIVVFDHLETAVYLRGDMRTNAVLIQHNDEAKLYNARLRAAINPLAARFLQAESRKFNQFQKQVHSLVSNKIFISSQEMREDEKSGGVANRLCVLPAFEYEPAARLPCSAPGDPVHVTFLGNMNWWPNRDAVNWLLSKVMPHLDSNIVLHLVGAGSDSSIYQQRNVIGHGFVVDAADIWRKSNIFIAPIISGEGMCVKVGEALYNRKSLISSSKGLRGIPIARDPSVIVVDSPPEWIALLRDSDRLRELHRNPPLESNVRLFDPESAYEEFRSFLERCRSRRSRVSKESASLTQNTEA